MILLLIHHLFYEEEYLTKCIFLLPFGKESIYQFALMSKVCVSMFLLLSGFGLYKARQNRRGDATAKDSLLFSVRHIKKLLIGYWWAVIPLAVFGVLTGMRSLSEVYGPFRSNKWKLVTDLLGVNYLLYGYTNQFNVTCWYLGIAILLYLLFPALCWLLEKSPFLFCGATLLVGLSNGSFLLGDPYWVLPFALGMLLAYGGVLDAICVRLNRLSWPDALGVLLCLVAAVLMRIRWFFASDAPLAFMIICALLTVVSTVKRTRGVLRFLGKHSANIFMTHTFFYYYYFPDFFYSFRFPSLILLSLLVVCVLYSMALESVKKYVRMIVETVGR